MDKPRASINFLVVLIVGLVTAAMGYALGRTGGPSNDGGRAADTAAAAPDPGPPVVDPAGGAVIRLDKGNVLYVGVENPITVRTAGVAPSGLTVSIAGGTGTVRRTGDSTFVVTVTQPGDAVLEVRGAGLREAARVRVLRVPDPVALLGGTRAGGSVPVTELRAQAGVVAALPGFDFEASCEVAGYTVTLVARGAERRRVENQGARFTEQARQLTNLAKRGDLYLVHDVRVRCPGDNAARRVNDLVFTLE